VGGAGREEKQRSVDTRYRGSRQNNGEAKSVTAPSERVDQWSSGCQFSRLRELKNSNFPRPLCFLLTTEIEMPKS
jgi:hypothetical protein